MTQPFLFEVEQSRHGRRPRAGEATAAPTAVSVATKPRRTRKRRPTVDPAAPANYTAGTDGDGRRTWMLSFPAPAPLMSINTAKHWRTTSPAKKTWRETTYLHAAAAKLPRGLTRVRVDVELRFPTAAKHDAPNYHPYVVKPIVDALGPARQYQVRKGPNAGKTVVEVGYGLIPDDTDTFLDGPFPRVGEPLRDKATPFGAVVVTITDLSDEVTP